jgi:hypothetical protein
MKMSIDDGSTNLERKARFRNDGQRLINGRQVNMVIALGIERGLRDQALLEWLEFEADVKVDKLEDIRDDQLSALVRKLRSET